MENEAAFNVNAVANRLVYRRSMLNVALTLCIRLLLLLLLVFNRVFGNDHQMQATILGQYEYLPQNKRQICLFSCSTPHTSIIFQSRQ